jgi:hypothetical protein
LSPLLAPNLPEIERELDALLQRDAAARVLAMRSPIRRPWPEFISKPTRRFKIAWCPSELQVRQELDEAEVAEADGVILLTPLDASSLGEDVVARFPRAKLAQTDLWSALRNAFKAREIDSRLRSHKWLAELLLERPPIEGYLPATAGVLDLESAWRAFTAGILLFPEGRADTAALLEWTLDPVSLDRFVRLAPDARSAIVEHLGDEGGAATRLVLSAVSMGRGAVALPIALVSGVVFAETEPRQDLRDASVRLEAFVDGARLEPNTGKTLAEAGRRVLNRLTHEAPAAARAAEARAATILADVRAADAAGLSNALQLGLEARIESAAAAVNRALETRSLDDASAAWDRAAKAACHDRADENRWRVNRMVMAARLVHWLMDRPFVPWRDMREAADAYAADGSFVDLARQEIRAGDPSPTVASAYSRLAKVVSDRREEENRIFGTLLRDWNLHYSTGEAPLPVERILGSVVALVARQAPVLLAVLDGLSFSVWRALAETIKRLGWSELVETQRGLPLVAAATLPSVTEVSRTSLLCGAVSLGNQQTERAGFTSNARLVAASRAGKPPRLFHKADLGVGPELGAEVLNALADPHQTIVGVVHNAVDAQLSGSDQLDLAWTTEGLRQFAALLQAARASSRVVIITGDHGHTLDHGTVQLAPGSGDRWRAGQECRDEREIALSGGRVLAPNRGTAIVAAWSERIRFAAKRNGYHGGVSPQEILVPVAVLSPDIPLDGWSDAPPAEPPWWRGRREDITRVQIPTLEVSPLSLRRRQTASPESDLFESDRRAEVTAGLPRVGAPAPDWLDNLFASETYVAQRRLAGRGVPRDEQIRGILVALSGRGGRMTTTGLSQALGLPAFRLAGLVSAARRVLNLDQAQILAIEGDDVVLDERRLRSQFGLGGER